LASLYFSNNDGIKYFCDLYEFGQIKNNEKCFYALMENGGTELARIKFPPKIQSSSLNKLNDVLFIIKECAKAIKVLHDSDILHCDIKPENFLFNEKDGNYNIKIIDFGFCKKNNTTVDSYFGTLPYMQYRFIYYIIKLGKYTITKHDDIYALGITFTKLLSIRFDKKSYYKSPIDYNILSYNNPQNTINERINNNIKNILINFDDNNIKDNLENILKKITYLNVCPTNLRTINSRAAYLKCKYTDLSEFIKEIDYLITLL